MRAVIFDMDGVLVDSEPTHVRVLSGVLAGYGHELTPQIYASLLGVAPYETWDRLAEHFALTGDPQEFLRRYVISVEDALGTPLAPKPGVLELIERLRRADVRLAVASMGAASWVSATLRGLGLEGSFDAVVTSDDVRRGKPHPDVFLVAAERLGVAPADCVVIEDSPRGIEAAHRAGMRSLAVRTAYNAGLGLPAHSVVGSLAEAHIEELPWIER